jgi:prepilin-type N-terminal cleavage/methylation domain-containing protein
VKTSNRPSVRSAFTLVEIMIVVTIIGLLAVIAVTNFMLARDTSRLNVIKRNLRDIDSAKEQLALERRLPEGSPVLDVSDLSEYLRGGRLTQVLQETYEPNPVGTPPTATLPAGVKLREYGPGATIPAP